MPTTSHSCWKQFCCFVCGRLFPLKKTSHTVQYFLQHYNAVSATSLNFDVICIHLTACFQQWKQARYLVCPVISCIQEDWHQQPDANAKSFLDNIRTIKCPTMQTAGPKLGSGALEVHTEMTQFVDHLASHFFETTLNTKTFHVEAHLPITCNGNQVICPLQNCHSQWQAKEGGTTLFLVHLINVHKLPILDCGDGLVVEEIKDNKPHY